MIFRRPREPFVRYRSYPIGRFIKLTVPLFSLSYIFLSVHSDSFVKYTNINLEKSSRSSRIYQITKELRECLVTNRIKISSNTACVTIAYSREICIKNNNNDSLPSRIIRRCGILSRSLNYIISTNLFYFAARLARNFARYRGLITVIRI